jgi:hypothetical protein
MPAHEVNEDEVQAPRWLLPLVLCVPLVAVGFGVAIFAAPGRLLAGALTGYTAAMLELIDACAPARERLGTPLGFSLLGGGFGGNYQAGDVGAEGLAFGRLEAKGPSGSGVVEYQLSKQNGQWVPLVLVLTVSDGTKVDIKACTREVVQQRQAESGLAFFRSQCAAGRADMCLAVGRLAQATGDTASAASFFRQACELGAAEACRLAPK